LKAEICIIGAGATGLMTAYFLSKFGEEDIIILEKDYPGSGSTFRCATGIRASFTTEEHIVLLRHAIDLWKELSDKLGFFYKRGGYLWLFTREKDVEAFKEFSKLHNKYGVPTRIVTPEEVKELVPQINVDPIIAALYDPLAGKADPFETIFALHSYCVKHGIRIMLNTKALELKVRNKEIIGVKTNKGEIECSNVVVAAGYGTRELVKTAGIDLPLENEPRHALITEFFKPVFDPLLIDWANSAYIVQTKSGAFLIGAEVHEKPGNPLSPRLDFLIKAAKTWTQFFPWLREVNILRYWQGYYVMSPDKHPIIGPIDEINGLYIAAGYSGHGFMMSPCVGEALAEWIVKGKPSYSQAERLTYQRIKEGQFIKELAVFG